MQSFIILLMAILLRLDGTKVMAYSQIAVLPIPRRHSIPVSPRSMFPTSRIQVVTALERGESLPILRVGAFNRVFRRGRKKVQVLEKEEKKVTKKEDKPEPTKFYRVMMYNNEYQPNIVAKVLATTIPSLDRGAAYELCTYARTYGKVAVVITTQKQADMYSVLLQRKGLPTTVELYDVKT
mmetsp:Transcript_57332/g.66216  ORF Transcript_57332/g.66216 Transcript_57332/m.66216 type:complete len:181 (-) Transcript_57332:265-807(-)